jgi:hypothetical protein
LSLTEFTNMMHRYDDAPEVVELWVRRIVRGHEDAFPELQAAG